MFLGPCVATRDLTTLGVCSLSALLRGLELVMPFAQAPQVLKAVIVTALDVVDIPSWSETSTTVIASPLAEALVAHPDPLADLEPIRWEAISPCGVLPLRHG